MQLASCKWAFSLVDLPLEKYMKKENLLTQNTTNTYK